MKRESLARRFVRASIIKADIDVYLSEKLRDAGYGAAFIEEITTALGHETKMTLYVLRPGMVIGRAGEGVRELERELSEKFNLENLTVAVAPIEVPEMNPHVMACRIAHALEKGMHFRRASFWALSIIKEAGALAAEITISGKLRTERATYETYRFGYMPKSGKPAEGIKEAITYVQLKPGIYGIKVRIMPPDAYIPDRPALQMFQSVEGEKSVSEEGEEVH